MGDELIADTGAIRTAAAVAASYVSTLQDSAGHIRRTVDGVDSAVHGSAAAAAWLHIGRRCADGTNGEAEQLDTFGAGLVTVATLIEQTDVVLAGRVPRVHR